MLFSARRSLKMSSAVSGAPISPGGPLMLGGLSGGPMLSSLSGVPGGQHTASLLGHPTAPPSNVPNTSSSTSAWVAEENAAGPPTGAAEVLQPPLPLSLGHPRGPPGPLRGVSRGGAAGPMPHEFAPFLRPMPLRPPFFIREIYKNGFLKRLPHNEKRSSALAKLMKSDRFWVVFSIHDDVHPFLELWHEPTEVASKPPQYIFPLMACQHISQSIIPADSEWSFVINFDTVAIRFSCNSREVMDDWVEVLRNKLSEMGILNPKGNLYSRVPLGPPVTKPVIRDPTSPLPQTPEAPQAVTSATPAETPVTTVVTAESSHQNIKSEESQSSGAKPRRQSIDTSAGQNQTFTTSIYLNQSPKVNSKSPVKTGNSSQSSLIVNRKTSLPAGSLSAVQQQLPGGGTKAKLSSMKSLSLGDSDGAVTVQGLGEGKASALASNSPATGLAGSGSSTVYINKSGPSGRHVTVIPINSIIQDNNEDDATKSELNNGLEEQVVELNLLSESMEYDNHTYGAIFDFDEKSSGKIVESEKEKKKLQPTESLGNGTVSPQKQEHSPQRRGRERRRSREVKDEAPEPPPLPHRPVLRRLSERKQDIVDSRTKNIHQKIRRKSRRSSSLGPLLDAHLATGDLGASTLSLESIDSNPRQAVPKSDRHLGAVPRRPLPPAPRQIQTVEAPGEPENNQPSPTHPLLGSPPRNINELPPGVRPPPYHPLASLGHPSPAGGFPPMIPLPGLTCQLSIPPGLPIPPPGPAEERAATRSVREQQVMRLRQEIGHPAGVRLQLRKKDCQSSLALVDLFGCVWVAGWKHREYPVLYNAFHLGDQILSVSGVMIRSSSDFTKLVKLKSGELHTEIIIRRAPFAQIFHLKPEIEGQSLGILPYNNTAEIKEVIPGSLAAQAGMQAKIRSFDGQSLVPMVLMEINGRPLNLLSKEGEAWERLQTSREGARDLSILLQPADIVVKFRKQLKSLRGYKDFLLS